LEPVSTLRVDQGNSQRPISRRETPRVSRPILLSAWHPAAPVTFVGVRWSSTVSANSSNTSKSPSSQHSIDLSKRLSIARNSELGSRPEATVPSLFGSTLRAGAPTSSRNLDSVRAPAIPRVINGNPLRMCGLEIHSFPTRHSHECALLDLREGVDPNGSLGGVHLSFFHPNSRDFAFRSSPLIG
jgi:hypothetical protein